MKFLTAISLLLAVTPSLTHPTHHHHKHAPNITITDIDILQYALTLEHLESKFYREGLTNFTKHDFLAAGFSSEFYTNLQEIAYDETTHVTFLTNALKNANATPVAECTYAFNITSPHSFITTATILEGVGVSAYLGAAASIARKTYLTSAASIMAVEARHSAFLRGARKQSPAPQPFDAPLGLNKVFTLAAPFIVSCPARNGELPLIAFPALKLVGSGSVRTGGSILLETEGGEVGFGECDYFAAWVGISGPVFVPVERVHGRFRVGVPKGFHGQSYVVITRKKGSIADEDVVAGPAVVEVEGVSGMD